MTTPPPDRQGQQLLVQLGVSALVGVVALVVLLQADSERGVLFWVLLAVVVSSAGEAAWFLSKYLRLARDRERIN